MFPDCAANRAIEALSQKSTLFFYKGKPTLLIGSGEHYGAVINLDFNYDKYLETLRKDGLNTTRLFTGAT
jgi:hypothetical protein